jgi:two-component sensor histidine kinase
MQVNQLGGLELDERALALLLGEFNHRIRNVFTIIQATVRQTQSASVEDFKAKLMARISGLSRHYEASPQSAGKKLGLGGLIEQTAGAYAANGALILTQGPDVELDPKHALVLHLVFHELAVNARKYGALSSSSGCVRVEWRVRQLPAGGRGLAISWSEHGGPEVKPSVHRGFGLRLIERVLEGHGGIRLRFNRAGLSCHILIELDAAKAGRLEPAQAAA